MDPHTTISHGFNSYIRKSGAAIRLQRCEINIGSLLEGGGGGVDSSCPFAGRTSSGHSGTFGHPHDCDGVLPPTYFDDLPPLAQCSNPQKSPDGHWPPILPGFFTLILLVAEQMFQRSSRNRLHPPRVDTSGLPQSLGVPAFDGFSHQQSIWLVVRETLRLCDPFCQDPTHTTSSFTPLQTTPEPIPLSPHVSIFQSSPLG